MMNREWIALIVAIIGLVGGIWIQVIQFNIKNHEPEKSNEDLCKGNEHYMITNTYLKERIQELDYQVQPKRHRKKGYDMER